MQPHQKLEQNISEGLFLAYVKQCQFVTISEPCHVFLKQFFS